MSDPQPTKATPAAYGCLHCTTAGSFQGDVSRMPRTCPTRTHDEVATDTSGYLSEERQALMHAADSTPFKPDGALRNRVEEVASYAQRRGMKRIGIAFCVSLLRESQRLAQQLQAEGLDLILQEECDVPVTTLVVKDRALDHHTVTALRSPLAEASRDTSPHLST